MPTFRRLLTAAVDEWDMMRSHPFKNKPSLMLKENNEQKRFLSEDEIKRLLAVSPPHLKDVIIGTFNSGLRITELLTLTWQQIKWDEKRIEFPKTKSGKKQDVILNPPLMRLFKDIRSRPVVDSRCVFIWQDWNGNWTPMKSIKMAFQKACKAARIPSGRNVENGVVITTLRHTYGSHLVIRRVTIYEVRDLMRHADVKTTMRYAHLSDETKQAATACLEGLTG